MKYFKPAILLLTGLILLNISWYAVARIRSKLHPVSVYSIERTAKDRNELRTHRYKVASFNIAHGRGGTFGETNWKHESKKKLRLHLDKIGEQIRNVNPDIILLNEIDFSSSWSLNINQAKYIAQNCGYAYVLEQKNMDVSFPFYRFCFGNALLSHYPLEDATLIDFKPYSKLEDIFVGNHDAFFCNVKFPSGPVGIFGIHFDYRSEDIRVRCTEVLTDRCAEIKYPVIVLGDFNSTHPGLPKTKFSDQGENAIRNIFNKKGFISYLMDSGYKSVYTFPSSEPDRLIDWIFGKGIASFSKSEKINSDLSDHLMIATEIEFEKH